jgi:hypothetical protein
MLEACWHDVRYAFRSLRRRPLVATVAILSLALGIGVNTAIFSVLDRLLLSQLPVPAPEELVTVTCPFMARRSAATGSSSRVDTLSLPRTWSAHIPTRTVPSGSRSDRTSLRAWKNAGRPLRARSC